MTGTDVIRASLESSKQWLMALVMDMKDAPTAGALRGGGNHAVWVLGHVLHSETGMLDGFVLGHAHQPGRYDELFGFGSQPVADASHYPSIERLAGEFENARARTLEVLSSFSDADLDRTSHAPQELKDMFGTIGQCFAMLGMHATFHAGQVADARRALGRKPLFG